ncbi:MAG: hypothetical protein MJ232_08820 [archaeon]|nr:hypothetical protein [archaeon]
MIVVKELKNDKVVTIVLRGGSKAVIDELHRSIHDALCVVRNLVKDNRIIVGGGASEIAMSIFLRN